MSVSLCIIITQSLLFVCQPVTTLAEKPEFSITLHTPQKIIYGSKTVEIGFQIIGLGKIDFGMISIHSDAINLIDNSFYFNQMVIGLNGTKLSYFVDTIEYEGNSQQNLHHSIRPAQTSDNEQHMIGGSVFFRTEGMGSGSYTVKISFLLQSEAQNYIFSESVQYTITNFNEKWLPYLLSFLIGLPAWIKILYDYFTSRPKIKGKIFNMIHAKFETSIDPTIQTAFLPYLFMTNLRNFSTYIIDYELYVNVGNGFEKLIKVYGNLEQIGSIDDGNISIPDFEEKLLGIQPQLVEYGKPLHGFVMFVSKKHQDYYGDKIKRTKLICLDSFGKKHTIYTKPKEYGSLYLLQDLANIRIRSLPKTRMQNEKESPL